MSAEAAARTVSGWQDVAWTDLPELAGLEQELFAHDAWTEATWWSELAGRPRREYLLVRRRQEPHNVLGYAGIDHGGDVADLMTIAVAPGSQGVGLGRHLLAEVVERARAGGATTLMLEVRADNASARTLYDRAGFEILSLRRRYYQPGNVDAVVMRLHLRAGERDATTTGGPDDD